MELVENQKKHIVFCSSSYYEYDRRIQRIIKSLTDEYKITWFSRAYHNNADQRDFNLEIIRCIFKRGVLFYLEFNLRLFFTLVLRRQYQGISSVDVDTLPAAWLAAFLMSKNIVFDAHELFHEVPELQGKRLRKLIWRTISRCLFSKIRYKYTVNASLQARFKEVFNTDFDIIMNVPSLDKYSELPQLANKRLVYIGVVNKGRGLEIAIEAMSRLKEYELHVLGEGDLFDQMKSLAGHSEARSRIIFHGYVAPSQLAYHLTHASIGLNILDPQSGNYYFSLANKQFDYMHAGLPVIAMNFPEYKMIQDEYPFALLLESYDVHAMVEAIRSLEDPDRYHACQSEALKAREIYNWQSESKKLKTIYKESMS